MDTELQIPFEEWETDDVTLAAYLKMHCHYIGTEWDGDQCYWLFEDTDELADLVSDYIGGRAEANLKEYNHHIASMKREMYEEQRNRRTLEGGRRRGQ